MAAPLRLQLCCIAQFFIYCIASSAVQAQQQQSAAHQNSSFMRLSHSPAFNFSPLAPVNMNVSNIAIPNIDYGYFFPILSSPSFKIWNSSADNPGFSLGFYFWFDSKSYAIGPLIYLAVCVGSSGNSLLHSGGIDVSNRADTISADTVEYLGPVSKDGFVVPVWFANLDLPIKAYSIGKVSLVLVTHDHNTSNVRQSLQLKDGDGEVVWRCCSNGDAAQMEMSNSGDFLIYNSAGAPVFRAMQGQRLTDTLVQGQRLSVGMQLTSNDSAYSARVEKGGLALYLNSMRQGAAPAAPYWVFPFFRNPDPINSPAHRPITLNQLLHSSPPNDSCIRSHQLYIPPYISVAQGFFDRGPTSLLISSGSNCSSTLVHELYIENYGIVNSNASQSMFGFLRLENDGKLYLYTVNISIVPYYYLSYYRFALDSEDLSINVMVSSNSEDSSINVMVSSTGASKTGLMADVIGRQQCDVPLGCGPLGLCTASEGLQSMCSCPDPPSFQPVNKTDFTKGCKRQKAFDLCSATTFAELESTANIFLLTGWTFFTDKNLQACKHVCSLDCSCQGISYQNSTSYCFLITQNISLLTITQDSTESAWNYTATSEDTFHTSTDNIVRKNDFVTHLKVASPVSNYTSTRFPLITFTGIIPFGIVMCFLLGLVLYHFRKRRSRLLQQAKEEEELRDILPLLPTRFSFKELQEATKRFSKLLGSGACGSVYEGTLLDGRKVAVKVLEGVLQRAHQAKDFLAEIATVGRTGHHNIVRLVGFCWQGSHHILVYEFMVKGSLDRWLFGLAGMAHVHQPLIGGNAVMSHLGLHEA